MKFIIHEVAKAQDIKELYTAIKEGYNFVNIDLADKNYDDIYEYVIHQQDDAYKFYCLANCYYYGLGVKKDGDKARSYFEKAALLGHAHAQYKLACIYLDKHVKSNYNKVFFFFHLAANQVYVPAIRMVGVCYMEGIGTETDPKAAFDAFKKAVQYGDIDAKFFYGLCYYYGIGTKRNEKEAIKYLTEAADKNIADAQFLLALFYEEADCGVKQDYQKAYEYNQKARQNWNFDACYNLYRFFKEGYYVQKDIEEAMHYLKIGAEGGSASSQFVLAHCYAYGIDVRKSTQQAFKWATKSAKQNHPGGQFLLAELYLENKIDEVIRIDKALYWFKKAVKNRNEDAAFRLGILYEKGKIVDKDKKTAIRWYKKAIELGSIQAKYRLASLYITEKNASIQTIKKALQLYEESANEGFASSEFVLGLIFEKGMGVKVDEEKALYWYQRAKEHGEKNADAYIKNLKQKMEK